MKELFEKKVVIKSNGAKCKILAIYSPNYAGGKYSKDGKVVYRLQNVSSNKGMEYFKGEDDFDEVREVKLLAYIDTKKIIHWSTIQLKKKGFKRYSQADKTIEE